MRSRNGDSAGFADLRDALDRTFFPQNALLGHLRIDRREMGGSVMTVYVLLAVLVIVVFLSVIGDGTGRSLR
jgi:hypothetical protein